MNRPRQQYVRPDVQQFVYEIDPRVTLAVTCKSTVTQNGPEISGCNSSLGGACSDTSFAS